MNTRNYIALILAVLLPSLFLGVSSSVVAVSYPPPYLYHREYSADTVMKVGEVVYLFHSGTGDVRSAIRPGETLTVQRITPACDVKAVGKVRIIAYEGSLYIKSKVVEGEIRPGDIAKQGEIAALVISPGFCSQ